MLVCIFELHNADKFEVYVSPFGPENNDNMRTRFSKAMTIFDDTSEMLDKEIAQIGRQDGIGRRYT